MYLDEYMRVVQAGQRKVNLLKNNPWGYFAAANLAGFYVGLGIILIFSIGGYLSAADSPWTKIIMGVSFGIALSLVMIAGAELYTGNVLIMAAGILKRQISWGQAGRVLLVSFIGNWTGSILVAGLYVLTGLSRGPIGEFIAHSSAVKMAIPAGELFFRGLLCNILVSLAVWNTFRLKEEVARLIMIFWSLFAFITSGFEHSVANMSLLMMALLHPVEASVSWLGYLYNIAVSTLGNVVGAALFIAVPYFLISKVKVSTFN